MILEFEPRVPHHEDGLGAKIRFQTGWAMAEKVACLRGVEPGLSARGEAGKRSKWLKTVVLKAFLAVLAQNGHFEAHAATKCIGSSGVRGMNKC